MTKKFFKLYTEIVNGNCPHCEEYTMLIGITRQFYRCVSCGTDLEQHVNGKITYLPHITSKTPKMKVIELFNGEKI